MANLIANLARLSERVINYGETFNPDDKQSVRRLQESAYELYETLIGYSMDYDALKAQRILPHNIEDFYEIMYKEGLLDLDRLKGSTCHPLTRGFAMNAKIEELFRESFEKVEA